MWRNAPNVIYMSRSWFSSLDHNRSTVDGLTWFPARPLGYYGLLSRFEAAWMVFTGRADALIWPPHEHDPKARLWPRRYPAPPFNEDAILSCMPRQEKLDDGHYQEGSRGL